MNYKIAKVITESRPEGENAHGQYRKKISRKEGKGDEG
jgi:hypothetical protein